MHPLGTFLTTTSHDRNDDVLDDDLRAWLQARSMVEPTRERRARSSRFVTAVRAHLAFWRSAGHGARRPA